MGFKEMTTAAPNINDKVDFRCSNCEIHITTSSLAAAANNNRSPKWTELSKRLIKKHPYCSACIDITNLETHHIMPFNLYPELELVKENCMVLCRLHHFVIGHFADWMGYNRKAERDAKRFKASMNRNYKTVRIGEDLK